MGLLGCVKLITLTPHAHERNGKIEAAFGVFCISVTLLFVVEPGSEIPVDVADGASVNLPVTTRTLDAGSLEMTMDDAV